MARLDYVCQLNMGQSPDSASYNDQGEGLPFFQGNADFGAKHPTVRVWCNAPTKVAHAGDVLISVRAPIGALNIATEDCCIGRGLAALTVNEHICSTDYLWHAIASKVDELNAKGTGSTFKAISKNVLAETEIPLPSMTTQTRIASILDRVDTLISLRKQQIAKLDELVKARFVEMFGDPKDNHFNWDTVPLGSLFSVGSSKRIYQNEQVPQGIPFLRISDLMERIEQGIHTAELFISKEKFDELQQDGLVPKCGDILVTSRGTLGRCYEIKSDEQFYFQDGMISWLSERSDRVNNTYIMNLFSMPGFRKQIDDVPAGSTVNYLSLARLKSLQVMCPPIDLQHQFAAFVAQTDQQKSTIQQSLAQLELLKKALMQKFFG